MKKTLLRGLSLLATRIAKTGVAGFLLLAGCRADQVTKAWAAEEFRTGPRTLVPHLLEFRYAENRAIAFSLLRDVPEKTRKPLIFGLAGIALAALATYAWLRRKQGLLAAIPLAFILAGAFGNLIDRFQKGYVVDFVHVHWRDVWSFPIFNLADSFITVGMVLLLWQSLRQSRSEGAPPQLTS